MLEKFYFQLEMCLHTCTLNLWYSKYHKAKSFPNAKMLQPVLIKISVFPQHVTTEDVQITIAIYCTATKMKSPARDHPTDHLQIIYHFFSEKLEQRGKGIILFHRN